jgi:glycosyltransferase involved in cell wall biosynthesis
MVAACPFPAPRGTPIRIYRIADELGRRGHEVDVFTYHLGSAVTNAQFRIHRIPNVKTYHKESPGPSYQKLMLLDPLLAVKLVIALRRRHYDVLHAHHAEGLLAALPAHFLFRIPLIFDVHTSLESELPYYRMGLSRALSRRLGRALDARLPSYADRIIAVSDDIRSAIVNDFGYAAELVSVIPNGVENSFCAASAAPQTNPMHAGPTVVYSGTLAAYQRIDLLLRAFAAAFARRRDLWLQIYTESTFLEFEPLARGLGIRDRIRIDHVDLSQLPAQLAAADVAVNPRTVCAGIPQKLSNYMAAGCPIVSFAGSAKYIEHERTGLVVPNEDVPAFAEAMLRLIADKDFARTLGAQARTFARHRLGWTGVAERIEAVYDQAMHLRAAAGCDDQA